MGKFKVGDKVIVKSKYFNEFNDHIGKIVQIADEEFHIVVEFDIEWSVDGLKVFDKYQLRKCK